VIANVALCQLDIAIVTDSRVIAYSRYVDDLVVVRDATGEKPGRIADYLKTWFPGVSDAEGGFAVDVGLGNRLRFQEAKTKVHFLTGSHGVEFLTAVRQSLASVSSDRRAFAIDVDRVTVAHPVFETPV
jgi:hypothetical protein